MRIKFKYAPTYVCERMVYHHDTYLAIFIGLELDATLNANKTMYQVTLHEVLKAFMRLKKDALVAIGYWSSHWNRVGLLLHECVYFPVDCCEVIVDDDFAPLGAQLHV